MRKLFLLLAVLALAAPGLAACGGDDSGDTSAATSTTEATGGGGGATVDVSADPNGELAFDPSSLHAPAGADTFKFDNPSSLTHDFCIEDSSGNEVGCTDQITQSSAELTETLKPGDYTFFCSVDGHREGGMEGTLTVK